MNRFIPENPPPLESLPEWTYRQMLQISAAINGLSVIVTPIYQDVLEASVTNIDIKELSGIRDGGYRIEMFLYNDTASAEDYYMMINEDYTVGNYRSEEIQASGATVTSARTSTPLVAKAYSSREMTYLTIDLDVAENDNSSTWEVKALVTENHRGGGNPEWVNRAWSYNTTATDITDIRFTSVGTDGIGLGSTIKVWRKK